MSSGTRTARYSDSAREPTWPRQGRWLSVILRQLETATAEAADVPHVGPALATPPDLPLACHPVAAWSLPSPRSRLHHLQNGGGLQKIYLKPTELPKCM